MGLLGFGGRMRVLGIDKNFIDLIRIFYVFWDLGVINFFIFDKETQVSFNYKN